MTTREAEHTTREQRENGHQPMMQKMAKEVSAHHLAPAPQADMVKPNFFPTSVMRGLAISTFIGAVIGLVFGYLLMTYAIVIPGWENLYSMGWAAFLTFWTMLGAALGIIIGGVGTVLVHT